MRGHTPAPVRCTHQPAPVSCAQPHNTWRLSLVHNHTTRGACLLCTTTQHVAPVSCAQSHNTRRLSPTDGEVEDVNAQMHGVVEGIQEPGRVGHLGGGARGMMFRIDGMLQSRAHTHAQSTHSNHRACNGSSIALLRQSHATQGPTTQSPPPTSWFCIGTNKGQVWTPHPSTHTLPHTPQWVLSDPCLAHPHTNPPTLPNPPCFVLRDILHSSKATGTRL